MSIHSVPEVGDTTVLGWGTWRVREYEVLHVVQVTPPGHYPAGFRVQVQETAIAAGSPDANSVFAEVHSEPQLIHVSPGCGVRFERAEVTA